MKILFFIVFIIIITIAAFGPAIAKGHISTKKPTPQTKTRKMTITAYCQCELCCGRFADGITASGHKIQQGDKFVAADASIPFGTKIRIPGYSTKPVPVLDRGGAIKGDRLDVFFNDHQKALQWGTKNIYVTFVDGDGNSDS